MELLEQQLDKVYIYLYEENASLGRRLMRFERFPKGEISVWIPKNKTYTLVIQCWGYQDIEYKIVGNEVGVVGKKIQDQEKIAK